MSIPVVLLTGYLGAGKTTVLNRLLASAWVREQSPALIINEFGKLGVDGKLVRGEGRRTYEINRGSLFCTCTQHQLVQALAEIADRVRPGLVLIESTGIAETRGLEGAMAIPVLTETFRVQANVCVVDALNFVKVAAFLPIAVTQVRWADGLVVAKGDQVAAEDLARLQGVLRELNPDAPQHAASFGVGVEDFVPRLRHLARAGAATQQPPADIVAVSVETDAAFDREPFLAAVRRLGPRLLRLKGNVDFGPGGRRFVEVVFDRVTEGAPADGFPSRTAFTAIGWKLPRATLEAALREGAQDSREAARSGHGPTP